jgi:hypothetical protein
MNSAAGASNVVVQQSNGKKNGKNASKQPVDLEVKQHAIITSITDYILNKVYHNVNVQW